MDPVARKRYATEVEDAKYGGLSDRQRDLLWSLLGQVTEAQARRALNHQAERDRFSFENLLADLRIAVQRNRPDAADKPHHPPTCSGGCEGGGWVPGPTAQLRMAADGTDIALARCPAGPEMTQAVWDGMKHLVDQWDQPAQRFDPAQLLAQAKITNHLTDRSPTS